MQIRVILLVGSLICLLNCSATMASSMPQSLNAKVAAAKAVLRGTVVAQSCYRSTVDRALFTRTILRVDEPLKGTFPKAVQLVHPGGTLNGLSQANSFSPQFTLGEECLLLLDARADGTLFAVDGSASAIRLHRSKGAALAEYAEEATLQSVRQQLAGKAQGMDTTSQAAEFQETGSITLSSKGIGGLMTDSNGISSRFIAPDRGEPIPYVVDAQILPTGISLSEALGAVSNAFYAWSQVSSARFVFAGLQNFGQPATGIQTDDPVIRIQLHDLYGAISGSTTLGFGGRWWSTPSAFALGGPGGKVAGTEFFESTDGFVVLKHTATTLRTLSNLEEVLCHELGHVLSLDHSSENPSEPDATLRDAIMYYTIHGGGRGTRLGAYDAPKLRLVHPFNTPPYGYNRIMDIVTAPTTPNVTGVNQVQLRGFDLQGEALTLIVTNKSANNGTFSLVGSTLKYTPGAYYNSGPQDPADGSYYDHAYARWSDGINASATAHIRVISYLADSRPSVSDGIPDYWMVQYFGNADPNVGSKHRAGDDADGDGVSNLAEFLCGTSPIDANSVLRITAGSLTNLQFLAKPYDVYEIQSSTNLLNWSLARNPVLPTVGNASCDIPASSAPRQFLRVWRVP